MLLPRIFECYVTKFARYKPLKLMVQCKLTFDDRVVLQRVAGREVMGELLRAPRARGVLPASLSLSLSFSLSLFLSFSVSLSLQTLT